MQEAALQGVVDDLVKEKDEGWKKGHHETRTLPNSNA
jgi:hypothetical protein